MKKSISPLKLQNQLGMSLVEVLIAVGLIGGVAVSLMQSRDVLNTNRRVLNQRINEDNLLRSIHMLLNDKEACLNTFNGLNAQAGQNFTQIRDEDNQPIYTQGMVLSRGSGSPLQIMSMRISHLNTRTALPTGQVYWNNQNQATVTINLARVSDLSIAGSGVATSGLQGTTAAPLQRRFQVLVETNGSGVVTDCLTDEDFLGDTFCEQIGGVLDVNSRCRSISLSMPGDTPPLLRDTSVAIRVDNSAHVVIDPANPTTSGVTAIVEKIELTDPANPSPNGFFESPTTNNQNRGIHARRGGFIDGYLLRNLTEIPAMGSQPIIPLTRTGNIHVLNNLTIGTMTTIPLAQGLNVDGEIHAPRIKLFGMEELVQRSNQNADHPEISVNHAATVGYVARRITNTLTELSGAGAGAFNSVLADILSNAPVQPQGAIALFRYVCSQLQVRNVDGTFATGTFAMVGTVPRCRFNFAHRMVNCSINPGLTGNPNNLTPALLATAEHERHCVSIRANEIHLNAGGFITNWSQLLP